MLRALLLGLLLWLPAVARAQTPAEVGRRAADAWLSRPELMLYEAEGMRMLHYAEVAAALGAVRLARVTGDRSLRARIEARHRRVAAEGVTGRWPHVDSSVHGVWPLTLGGAANLATGLAYADGQWAGAGPDGLTREARYWIDDIWMIGALQVEAWRASGDAVYLDRAALTARLYIARLQQPNGLFHHGPDAPFFWARGNGWVAAGLAEILAVLPRRHPAYEEIAAGYRRMMAALLRHQGADGMWRQLVDRPEAWNETSGTAMFGYAMALGVRRGLLAGPTYRSAARRAWAGLARHVGADGRLAEVSVGTGQSRDAAYYLARPRATGDLHGQAALLWFAAELVRR